MDNTKTIYKMVNTILKMIHNTVRKHEDNNKVFKAQIVEVVNSKKYRVLYHGRSLSVTSGTPYKFGDWVWVCVPGSWNDLFVMCKA